MENIKNNYDSDLDSDSENSQYIDLTDYTTTQTKNIYQFHINEDKLILKYIGKSSYAPDMIIKENFGPEFNLNLYNCVFTNDELESVESVESNNIFFPLIKLVNINKKNHSYNKITSFAVKINQKLEYDNEINQWELYFVEDDNLELNILTCPIEKNINSTNIVEKIIEYSIRKK
jgi:hypothetical protein